MIAAVSMARMTRVKWVDKENMVACVEAGAIGTPSRTHMGRFGLCCAY